MHPSLGKIVQTFNFKLLQANYLKIYYAAIYQKGLQSSNLFLAYCKQNVEQKYLILFFKSASLFDCINGIELLIIFVSSKMRKLVLSITIIILSITITISNLIKLGDFQNLVTFSRGYNWSICGAVCNNTWFASTGTIELGYVASIYTINAELQNGVNFRLCQNVSSMEIGKIYIFSFDMLCDRANNNCSMWVIVNNQVVNGSNYSSYDHFSHKVVGYFNSTLSKNTICFQSRESPTVANNGARIDNITLNTFNGSLPCNVSDCKLCVLNFLNSCYACQAGYTKQPDQTCTDCSAMISNCTRCQRFANQYICLQCGSQFWLNIQGNFCYHNSEIFFTSEVLETASVGNSFIIKTNLSTDFLIQAGFSIQDQPLIMIKINGDIQQNFTITLDEGAFLEVELNLMHQYQKFAIELEVEQGFIQINNTYFSIRTQVKKKPQVYMSETQIAIFQKYDELAEPIIGNLDTTFAMIKNSGLGFFIANIFNFLTLITVYSYLDTYQPKTFRLFIEKLSSQLNSCSLYSLINLQTQVYEIAQYQVTEKIESSSQEWSGPLQAGFSTNFYRNNLQPFTIMGIFTVRLFLCWILHKIFKPAFLQSSNSQRYISISSQFYTVIPIIILPSFNLIIKSIASEDYVEKINTILHITVLFICLLTPFVNLITQLQQIRKKISKERKQLKIQMKKSNQIRKNEILQFEVEPAENVNQQFQKEFAQRKKQLNKEQKNKLIQVKFRLVQRLKLLSIPIFVVFQQVLYFLVFNLCLLLINFGLSLKLKKYFPIYNFVFNIIISLAWLLVHCCFCVFFIIQKWFFDQGQANTVLQISKYLSYAAIIIILFGAAVQILYCVIDILNAFRKMVIYAYQNYKKLIKTTPQRKKKQTIKSQKVCSKQIRNKEQSKIEFKQKKSVKKLKTQNTNSGQNYQDPGVNRQLFYFYPPQTIKKSTGILKLNNQTKSTLKIKKVKQQGKNCHLTIKFNHQN